MLLRRKFVLLYPESTETPSANSGGAAPQARSEERLPAGSSVPTERNDGHEEDDGSSDNETVDWAEESEPVNDDEPDTTPTGDDTASPQDEGVDEPAPGTKPAAKPAQGTPKPAAKPQGQDTQTGGEGDDTASPNDDQPPADGGQPKQETPEEKQAREQREAEARQQRQDQLTQYYALSEEDSARLATEPEKVLPTLAAKVQMAVEAGMQQYVAQVLPQAFQQFQAVQRANEESKNAFYSRWPSLKGYERQVLQVGAMFRQMNPKASSEEALEKIGRTVCAALGINPDPAPGNGTRPAPGNGTRAPVARRPAKPGGVGASHNSARPPADNEFAAYAEQMLEEDQNPS